MLSIRLLGGKVESYPITSQPRMNQLHILYRAEGSRRIGTGHVLRAVRLSEVWHNQGIGEVTLALSGDEVGAALAERAAATVIKVNGVEPLNGKPVFHADSLANAVGNRIYDVAVVDMLDTGLGELAALSGLARTVVTLDDRGPGRTEADALINILVREPHPERLPSSVRLMQGPQYATLDASYAEPTPSRSYIPAPCRVLVTLGGSDSSGLTVKVACAMSKLDCVAEATFVCGVGAVHDADLRRILKTASWPGRILQQVPTLRDLLIDADVAVVAGGLTMHEACRVGTPALAVCQPIDHQEELAEWFRSCGAMETVGNGVSATLDDIRGALARLICDSDARNAMGQAGPPLVDGKGTERTASAIAALAKRPIKE